jgi:hypothetical protein
MRGSQSNKRSKKDRRDGWNVANDYIPDIKGLFIQDFASRFRVGFSEKDFSSEALWRSGYRGRLLIYFPLGA